MIIDAEGLYKLARITCFRAAVHRNPGPWSFNDWVQDAVINVLTQYHKFDPARGSQRNFFILYMRQEIARQRETLSRQMRTPPGKVWSIDVLMEDGHDVIYDRRISG